MGGFINCQSAWLAFSMASDVIAIQRRETFWVRNSTPRFGEASFAERYSYNLLGILNRWKRRELRICFSQYSKYSKKENRFMIFIPLICFSRFSWWKNKVQSDAYVWKGMWESFYLFWTPASRKINFCVYMRVYLKYNFAFYNRTNLFTFQFCFYLKEEWKEMGCLYFVKRFILEMIYIF